MIPDLEIAYDQVLIMCYLHLVKLKEANWYTQYAFRFDIFLRKLCLVTHMVGGWNPPTWKFSTVNVYTNTWIGSYAFDHLWQYYL